VDYGARALEAEAWAAIHGIGHPSEDVLRIGLLLVDCQNTFCIPGYELFVGGRSGSGAVDDNNRLCQFIYRNLDALTEITATLDTHTALQIFHPVFWLDEEGEHPIGGQTEITLADVEDRLLPQHRPADGSALRGEGGHATHRELLGLQPGGHPGPRE